MSEKVTLTLSDEMAATLRESAKDELNERAEFQKNWVGEEAAELSHHSEIDTATALRFHVEETAKKSVRR